MIQTKSLDLFVGIPVADYPTALKWYERLLGSPPTFFPTIQKLYGSWRSIAICTWCSNRKTPAMQGSPCFVGDLDALIAQIAERGLEPAKRESYSNGVSKITYRDPDGNEIGFGSASR